MPCGTENMTLCAFHASKIPPPIKPANPLGKGFNRLPHHQLSPLIRGTSPTGDRGIKIALRRCLVSMSFFHKPFAHTTKSGFNPDYA